MKFTIQGETYDYDDSKLSVDEARLVKEHTGMGVTTWSAGIRDGDPDALLALLLLAKKRAGEAAKWDDLNNINVMELVVAVLNALNTPDDGDQADDSPAEDEHVDPTPPPAKKARGKTPKDE